MPYTLRPETPSVEDYIAIRLAAGLSRKSEAAARRGLPNSLYAVVVYFEQTPIGIGRVIGDGGCFYEITDIAVLPAHQKQGVGDMIMRALVAWLRETAPPTAYVTRSPTVRQMLWARLNYDSLVSRKQRWKCITAPAGNGSR
jgi:GNAT superfamily N-acetyltransferase